MLKNFTKGEKKLLKGLIMEYFHFIMMKSMKKNESWKGNRRRGNSKEKTKKEKRKNKNKIEYHLIQMNILSGWLIRKKHT